MQTLTTNRTRKASSLYWFFFLTISVLQSLLLVYSSKRFSFSVSEHSFLLWFGLIFLLNYCHEKPLRLAAISFIFSAMITFILHWPTGGALKSHAFVILTVFYSLIACSFTGFLHRGISIKNYQVFFDSFWDSVITLLLSAFFTYLSFFIIFSWMMLFVDAKHSFIDLALSGEEELVFLLPVVFNLGIFICQSTPKLISSIKNFFYTMTFIALPINACVVLSYTITWAYQVATRPTIFFNLETYLTLIVTLLCINFIYLHDKQHKRYPRFIEAFLRLFIIFAPISNLATFSMLVNRHPSLIYFLNHWPILFISSLLMLYAIGYSTAMLCHKKQAWTTTSKGWNIVVAIIFLIVMPLINNPLTARYSAQEQQEVAGIQK